MSDPLEFTARSPRLDLPFLFAAQAQKEATINEALARIDALIAPLVEGEVATPPGSPAQGSCWIVGADGQGDWAGHKGELAFFSAGTWMFARPRTGMTVFDLSTDQYRHWIDGWQALALPPVPAGGTTVDSQARNAIAALIEGLRVIGIGV
ncbi:DUF2793 domain-containing protein [Alteriqipengyuania sp. 357]